MLPSCFNEDLTFLNVTTPIFTTNQHLRASIDLIHPFLLSLIAFRTNSAVSQRRNLLTTTAVITNPPNHPPPCRAPSYPNHNPQHVNRLLEEEERRARRPPESTLPPPHRQKGRTHRTPQKVRRRARSRESGPSRRRRR